VIEKNVPVLYCTSDTDDYSAKLRLAVECFEAFLKPRLHITSV